MTRTSLSNGLYQASAGEYWFRPTINGRRTWKRLASATESEAAEEIQAIMTDHKRAKIGLTRDPFGPKDATVRDLAREKGRVLPAGILSRFGGMRVSEITVADCVQYGATRGATRAADIELAALSSLITAAGGQNPIKSRPRIHVRTLRHSRECMPKNADEIHEIARRLLPSSVGWQFLFACLTGCRTDELLSLRFPLRVEGRFVYVRRAKGGVNHFVELTCELSELIQAHMASRDTPSPWMFPGSDLFRPLNRVALTHALARVSPRKITAHGCRAYYVTVWRSRGETNEQVASRIGDKTSALIESTYGALPESWSGGAQLGWLPTVGEAAWAKYTPGNVVNFSVR